MVIQNLIKLTRFTIITWAEGLAQQLKSLAHEHEDRGSVTWNLCKCLVDVAAHLDFSLGRRFRVRRRNSACIR